MSGKTGKRMAGDYEIFQAVHIGDKEIVLGENPQDTTGAEYMCAFCQNNALFDLYSDVMCSNDFPEIAELFGRRIAEQAQSATILSHRRTVRRFPIVTIYTIR